MITVYHILRGDTLLAGTNGDGHTVFVRTSDEHHVALLQTQVTYVDVGRYVNASQVTNMHTTIGIGQGRGHSYSLIIFLFHIHY